MKQRSLTTITALTVMVLALTIGHAQSQKETLRVFELITLNDGYQLDDHIAYSNEINHILKRHHLKHLENFKVLKKARGTAADHVAKIGIIQIDSPENLKGVFSDKEYNEKMVPKRDKIHDMENITFFMAKPIFEKEYDSSKMVLVNFIVMNEGHDSKARDKYFNQLEKIGKKHGLKRFAAYEVVKFMRGVGPKEATLINLYEVGPETFKNLMNDSRYQKNMVPQRDKIFNMQEVSVFMTQSL